MKRAFGTAAFVVATVAASFPADVDAGGYGCATCAAPQQPCCAPAQPCQPPVQHVHYHQKHCLFGHHHAPMMVPMTQPVMQVPVAMAMAPVAVQPVALTQEVARVVVPARESVRFIESDEIFVRRPTFETSRVRSFDSRETAIVLREPRTVITRETGDTRESGVVDADLDQIRAMVNEVRAIRDNLISQQNTNESAEVERDAEIDALRAEVKALDDKFEDFKRCIAACVTAKAGG